MGATIVVVVVFTVSKLVGRVVQFEELLVEASMT